VDRRGSRPGCRFGASPTPQSYIGSGEDGRKLAAVLLPDEWGEDRSAAQDSNGDLPSWPLSHRLRSHASIPTQPRTFRLWHAY
jgi:hypothetical protein